MLPHPNNIVVNFWLLDPLLPGLEAHSAHWSNNSIAVETVYVHACVGAGMEFCLSRHMITVMFTFDGGFGFITTASLSPSLISLVWFTSR